MVAWVIFGAPRGQALRVMIVFSVFYLLLFFLCTSFTKVVSFEEMNAVESGTSGMGGLPSYECSPKLLKYILVYLRIRN
jgi:hypothetical protein